MLINFTNFCGTSFYLGRYQVAEELPWPIEWIVGHTDAEYVYCISRYILDQLAFDASEPKNPDENRKKYGNNNYGFSNIRQFLNSDSPAGEWYAPQHEYDEAPNYSNRPGFLFHWTDEEKALLQDMELTLMPDTIDEYTVMDKIWLPTEDQLFGAFQRLHDIDVSPNVELEYFRSYEMRKATIHPKAHELSPVTLKPNIDDSWRYWVASPDDYSHSVLSVNREGILYYDARASIGHFGIRPCIKIKKPEFVLK